jgi:NADH:ubiquinone oxidoreductase subunit 6 (subunit J)
VSFLDAFVRALPTLGLFTLAAIILVSGFMVSQARRITHAAFFMVLAFTGVAGVFILLGADFLGAAQVLIYVGAIAVMFLFAIMVSDLKELSDNPRGTVAATTADGSSGAATPAARPDGSPSPRGAWSVLSGLVALGFAGFVLAALAKAGLPAVEVPAASGLPTTAPIGRALFTTFLLPFEVASIVLLAALVGAIVIAAREGGGEVEAKAGSPPTSAAGGGKGDAA